MTRRQLFKLGAAAALTAGALLGPGCDRIGTWLHPDRCALCHRMVHAGMAVRVAIADRPPETACCLRCAITYAKQTGRPVRILSVSDYPSHRPIAAAPATYVVGSAIEPCGEPPMAEPARRGAPALLNWDRCLPSIIAFAKRADAEEFQTQNGGTIESFHDLVAGTPVFAAPRGAGLATTAGARDHA